MFIPTTLCSGAASSSAAPSLCKQTFSLSTASVVSSDELPITDSLVLLCSSVRWQFLLTLRLDRIPKVLTVSLLWSSRTSCSLLSSMIPSKYSPALESPSFQLDAMFRVWTLAVSVSDTPQPESMCLYFAGKRDLWPYAHVRRHQTTWKYGIPNAEAQNGSKVLHIIVDTFYKLFVSPFRWSNKIRVKWLSHWYNAFQSLFEGAVLTQLQQLKIEYKLYISL